MAPSDRSTDAGFLDPDDAILVLEQADLAAQANLPLQPALRAMAEDAPSPGTRWGLCQLANRLDAGEPIGHVMSSLQPHLSPLMQTLIQQGTEIGRLDTVLHWATEQAHRTQILRRHLIAGLAYPLILCAIGAWIGSLVLIVIVPMFNTIFDDFGTELPWLTVRMMQLSKVGLIPGVKLVVVSFPAIVIAMFLAVYYRNSSKLHSSTRGVVSRVLDRCGSLQWLSVIPLIGSMNRLATLAEFCNLMAVFIEIRLPIHQAVRLAGQATSDPWLRVTCERLSAEIDMGTFSPPSAQEMGMPIAIAQMLYGAKSAESLAESLRGLGEIYASRAEMNSRSIGVIAEPFVVIAVVVGLGAIVVALFLPMIKLLNDLS